MATQLVREGRMFERKFRWLVRTTAYLTIPCEATAFFRWDKDSLVENPEPESVTESFLEYFVDWYRESGLMLAHGFSPVARCANDDPPYCITHIGAYRVVEENGQLGGIRCEPNEFWKVVTEHLSKFKLGNCSVAVVNFHIDAGWTLDLIEENAKVASEKILETLIPVDQRYNIAVEYAAAKAQKKVIETWENARQKWEGLLHAQSNQEVETPQFKLRIEQFGQAVQIHWAMVDGLEHVELLGFRQEGSFHPDAWAGVPENGSLQVHASQQRGSVVQHLDPGKTYYYTFYIPKWETKNWLEQLFNAPPTIHRYVKANARFTVRIPTAEETKRLEEAFTAVARQRKHRSLETEVAERVQIIKDKLLRDHLTKAGVWKSVNEMIEEIKTREGLSDADRDYLGQNLSSEAERLIREARL